MAEEAPAREWTAAQMEIFRSVSQKNWDYFQANATAENKAKADEELAKFKSGDQAFIGEAMERMTKMFADADANSDGRLTREESDAFFKAMEKWETERGQFGGTYDTGYQDNYAAMNCVSEEDGYTFGEFMEAWGPMM